MRFLLAFFIFALLLLASPLYAASCDPDIPGDCPAGLDQLEVVVGSVISVAVGLGFIAMLVMIVLTGLKYITSGGEPKALQSANYTLTWALLGILFFALVWIILQLVEAFTGVKVTTFDLKTLL